MTGSSCFRAAKMRSDPDARPLAVTSVIDKGHAGSEHALKIVEAVTALVLEWCSSTPTKVLALA
jgi:hypothetical protein